MDLIYTLYNDDRTVFRLKDVAMLTGETSFNSLNMRLNYYVRTGRLQNPRKGCTANQITTRKSWRVEFLLPPLSRWSMFCSIRVLSFSTTVALQRFLT